MNFHNPIAVDTLLGRLLAFLIMFEKKIEFLRCKLAGNEQFHTRLAFQKLVTAKANQITAQDLYLALHAGGNGQSEGDCQFFIRKYSRNASLSYEEFLKILTPKSNKILSQRIMIRTFKKGATLEDYLFKTLLELLQNYIKMCAITENIRRAIQKNEDLTHLEIIEFFHLRIDSPAAMLAFLARCGEDDQQYDIEAGDAIFLSYGIKSGNEIHEFTDLDIKQLICPIDMVFQKGTALRQVGHKQPQFESPSTNQAKTTTNFLGKTYQKIYQNPIVPSSKTSFSKKSSGVDPSLLKKSEKIQSIIPQYRESSRFQINSHQQSYGGLYIDNFTKSDVRSRLQINRYAELQPKKDDVVLFEDELSYQSNLSRGSAFDQS